MRILFLENRYSTYLWDAIAHELENNGHEIYWIVQNREFTPKTGKIFQLDITDNGAGGEERVYDAEIDKVIRADRGLNYFGVKSHDHLFSIKRQIADIVNSIQPQVGFGECSLHHEMIAMQTLRRIGVPYLFPTSCRYPLHRFSFYLYDRLMPFAGSQETVPYQEALDAAHAIAERRMKPAYMNLFFDNKPGVARQLTDKVKILRGYINGERYNTPSPIQKFRMKHTVKRNTKKWDSIASYTLPEDGSFILLYPMHMQPETSVDVWATEFSRQHQVIQQLLAHSGNHVKIAIKPNPTSNLEISEDLINIAENNDRIIPLHHSVKMEELLDATDLVVTITGTIGLECAFANKPVITLIHSFLNHPRNCLFLDKYEKLGSIIQSVRNGSFPTLTETEKAEFYIYLNKISYSGSISCTYWQSDVTHPKNLRNLTNAFTSVINTIRSGEIKSTSPEKVN